MENKYYGKVMMGALRFDANRGGPSGFMPPPQKPWWRNYKDDGDVIDEEKYIDPNTGARPRNGSFCIVESPSEEYTLTWNKVRFKDDVYLICDRVIFYQGNSSVGNSFGLYRETELGGRRYKQTLVENDTIWDQVVCNKAEIPGLLAPSTSAEGGSFNEGKLTTPHADMWHASGAESVIGPGNNTEYGQKGRGGQSPSYAITYTSHDSGFRPVLKLLPYDSEISGQDENLGDKVTPFQYTYSISQNHIEGPLVVVIKLDDSVIEEYISEVPIVNKVLSLESHWSSLGYGKHIITIDCNNKRRTIKFNKVASRPEALPDASGLGQSNQTLKETEEYMEYLRVDWINRLTDYINSIF